MFCVYWATPYSPAAHAEYIFNQQVGIYDLTGSTFFRTKIYLYFFAVEMVIWNIHENNLIHFIKLLKIQMSIFFLVLYIISDSDIKSSKKIGHNRQWTSSTHHVQAGRCSNVVTFQTCKSCSWHWAGGIKVQLVISHSSGLKE